MRTANRQSGMTLIAPGSGSGAAPLDKGFTLIELLVVLSIVVILIGVMSTFGMQLKKKSQIQLTRSTLDVIDTAVEQYFSDTGSFPPAIFSEYDFEVFLYGNPPANTVTVSNPVQVPDTPPWQMPWWSSQVLFYYLSRNAHSASIIDALMDEMISGKGTGGSTLLIEIPTGGQQYDLIRFLDAWGNPIWYVDPGAGVFPIITSAGPDEAFGTPDDINNQ